MPYLQYVVANFKKMKTSKIIISSVGILIAGLIIWVVIGQNKYQRKEESFNNIKVPENSNLKKPIEYLNQNQIDSILRIKVDKEKIEIIGTGYSGYDFYIWHKPTEKGEIFIKAFEITQNQILSQEQLFNKTRKIIEKTNTDFELYKGNSLIYEGGLGKYYPVRFELWFKSSETGNEQKLTEKEYLIDGWDR